MALTAGEEKKSVEGNKKDREARARETPEEREARLARRRQRNRPGGASTGASNVQYHRRRNT